MKTLIDILTPHNSIAIAGMSKNSGKTTTLNHLINGFNAQGICLGLTSIGLDGEQTDLVTNTPKPRIFAPCGSIIATAEKLLTTRNRDICGIAKEILSVTDIHTPLGRIAVARTLSGGAVMLAGPSATAQIPPLIYDMSAFGAQKIIVDGAVGRKSLAMPNIAQAVVLCVGAALSKSMDSVIMQTRHITDIFNLPEADLQSEHVYIPGAVTDAKLIDLYDKYVVADDASKILITPPALEKMRIRGGALAVKRHINLAAVTINPISPYGTDFNAAQFLEKIQAAINVPAYNIGGENYTGT